MITREQKRSEIQRLLGIMEANYPAMIADWRIREQIANFRISVMRSILNDYTDHGTETDQKTGAVPE